MDAVQRVAKTTLDPRDHGVGTTVLRLAALLAEKLCFSVLAGHTLAAMPLASRLDSLCPQKNGGIAAEDIDKAPEKQSFSANRWA